MKFPIDFSAQIKLNRMLVYLGIIFLLITYIGFHYLQTIYLKMYVDNYIREVVNPDALRLKYEIEQQLINKGEDKESLEPILDRYHATLPLFKQLIIQKQGRFIADSARRYNASEIPSTCQPIDQLTFKSLHKNFYCYYFHLKQAERLRSNRYSVILNLNGGYFTTGMEHGIQQLMRPVMWSYLLIGFLLFFSFWLVFVRSFDALIRWLKDPKEKADTFVIIEFNKITRAVGDYLDKLFEHEKVLRVQAETERYLRSIMDTVSKIDELLVKEKNETNFLSSASQILSRHKNYLHTSIDLYDEEEMLTPSSAVTSLVSVNSLQRNLSIPGSLIQKRLGDHNQIVLLSRQELEACCSDQHYDEAAINLNAPLTISNYTVAVVPLIIEGTKPIGFLTLLSTKKEGFVDEEVAMLIELGGDIAFAINAFKHQEKLENMSYVNSATGLPNSAKLQKDLPFMQKRIAAMMNIDRFKSINKLYGIKIGDTVLGQLAQFIEDAIDPYAALYHYVSDEFVIVFEKHIDKKRAESLMESLLETLENHTFLTEEIEISLSARIGATVLETGESIQELQFGVTSAKEMNKTIAWYTPDLQKRENLNTISLFRQVHKALEEQNVVCYFQAIVDLSTNERTHYESLVRIIAEDGNVLLPYQFLDFVKQTRLYPSLTRKVFEQSIRAIPMLDASVAINLSVFDILNPQVTQMIYTTLQTTDLPYPVIFEILESEGIENYDEVNKFIENVKDLGAKIAIDDFGSGYANFTHIARLNADYLKIDGSLIKHIGQDRRMYEIVRHVNQISHEIGMETIAEFVFDETVRDLCGELGIDLAQGYVLHKPASLEQITGSPSQTAP